MKNKIQNTVLFAIIFISNIAFSQPDADGAGGTVDPTDSAAPIDSNLIYLAIIGLFFCYFQFKKRKIVK